MAKKKTVSSKTKVAPAKKKAKPKTITPTSKKKSKMSGTRLIPPPKTVVVRMYRIGHGDCFLLAFPGESADEPVYVLIDCGYKPGSPSHINTTPKDIAADIRAATGNRIDIVVMTHEHQDHVNAFTQGNYKDVEVGEVWLAWTEDPKDSVARKLRAAYKDKLLGLVEARNRLAAADGLSAADDKVRTKRIKQIDEFLAFETGGEGDPDPIAFAAAAKDPASSQNKKAMKLIKDKASHIEFLKPHEKILTLPGGHEIRAFALGPPRDADVLKDLDPQGDEEFHLAAAMRSPDSYFALAAAATNRGQRSCPFSVRYSIALEAAQQDSRYGDFFSKHYGHKDAQPEYSCSVAQLPDRDDLVADNADWRRIDNDWLQSADALALAMNGDTNNASLVLAFELGRKGKVLLFAADAQRGNWLSWADAEFDDDDSTISAKDLLRRTVLYKVGHHCSHNATMNGDANSEHPCIGWMAQGKFAKEFTSMITAVRSWAETQNGWDHPRKEIKDALIVKCSGRVLQTDTDIDKMTKPSGVTDTEWKAFQKRVTGEPLYFDLTVTI